jgi:hypothetical protein
LGLGRKGASLVSAFRGEGLGRGRDVGNVAEGSGLRVRTWRKGSGIRTCSDIEKLDAGQRQRRMQDRGSHADVSS